MKNRVVTASKTQCKQPFVPPHITGKPLPDIHTPFPLPCMRRTVKPGATHLQNQGVLVLQTFARAVVQCQHSFPGVPVRILSNILMFQEYSRDSPLVFPFVTHCHSGGMYSEPTKFCTRRAA